MIYNHNLHYFPSEIQMRAVRMTYVEYFRAGEDVLDLGCGRGEFLELLEKKGCIAFGVEVDSDLAVICARKGLKVLHSDVLEFLEHKNAKKWDGIFIGHLVEHFDSASALRILDLASQSLNPYGRLVILTPNPNFLPGIGEFWSDMTHLRPYTLNGLKDLFPRIGLRVVAYGIDPNSKLRVSWRYPMKALINFGRLFLLRLLMLENYSGGEIFIVGERK